MKKAIIASVIALTMGAGVAHAAPDANAGTIDLTFEGTVSTVTCPLELENGKTNIALGQTEKNTTGTDIALTFTPKDKTACTGNTNFVMYWEGVGSAFGTNGLPASGGLAKDSFVLIKATNASSQNNNQPVNANGFQYEFAKDTVLSGLKYTANLKGGNTVGNMTAAAKVYHWYK